MHDLFEDEPRRPTLQAVLLAAIVMMIGSGILFTGRPLMLSNSPRIDRVAELPASVDRAELAREVVVYPYWVPQRASFLTRFVASAGAARAQDYPVLGYSVREVTILGLPLFGYTELGFVVAIPGLSSTQATPISDEQLAALDRQAGEKLERGWLFPFWKHSWGLLALAAAGLAVWLELRFQAHRRAVLGII